MHEAGSDQGDAVWWEDNEYLIAGGVAGTVRVVICQRGDGGRNLTEFARNTDIPARTSFVWVSVRAANSLVFRHDSYFLVQSIQTTEYRGSF
jgi:hypothetical protein